MKISHLLFDADGVLQTWLPGTLASLRALPQSPPSEVVVGTTVSATPQDGPDGPQDPLVSAFLRAVFAAEEPCLRGKADFAEQLQPVLSAWGVQQPLQQVLKIWQAIYPYPGMFELIKNLRTAGLQVHLATNQQSTRAAYMRNNLGYDALFDRSFYSCDLGFAKPAPEYFTQILSSLEVCPSQVLFVDDRKDNVAAAMAVGLQGLHFEARQSDDPSRAFIAASAAWQLPLF